MSIRITGPSDLLSKVKFDTGFAIVYVDNKREILEIAKWISYKYFAEIDTEPFESTIPTGATLAVAINTNNRISDGAVTLIESLLARHGIMMLDVISIDNNKWRSEMCEDTECCPLEGKDVITRVSPRDLASQIESDFMKGVEPEAFEVLINQIKVRDWLFIIAAKRGDEVWKQIVELTPEPYTAQGWATLGAAWVALNEFTAAKLAFDRALAIDPYCNLAGLLGRLVESEVPGSVWIDAILDTESAMLAEAGL